MPKQQMCSGAGDGSWGKEASGPEGFWHDNFTLKPTQFSLGSIATAAAGVYIYNSIVADSRARQEKNIRRYHEQTERHNRDIEHYSRVLEELRDVNMEVFSEFVRPRAVSKRGSENWNERWCPWKRSSTDRLELLAAIKAKAAVVWE